MGFSCIFSCVLWWLLQFRVFSSSQQIPINKYQNPESTLCHDFSFQHLIFPKAVFLSWKFHFPLPLKFSVSTHSRLTIDHPTFYNKTTGQQVLEAAKFRTRLLQVYGYIETYFPTGCALSRITAHTDSCTSVARVKCTSRLSKQPCLWRFHFPVSHAGLVTFSSPPFARR